MPIASPSTIHPQHGHVRDECVFVYKMCTCYVVSDIFGIFISLLLKLTHWPENGSETTPAIRTQFGHLHQVNTWNVRSHELANVMGQSNHRTSCENGQIDGSIAIFQPTVNGFSRLLLLKMPSDVRAYKSRFPIYHGHWERLLHIHCTLSLSYSYVNSVALWSSQSQLSPVPIYTIYIVHILPNTRSSKLQNQLLPLIRYGHYRLIGVLPSFDKSHKISDLKKVDQIV